MKTEFKISFRIIVLFLAAIIISTIPDLYPNFFGDKLCTGVIWDIEHNREEYFFHYGGHHKTLTWHWGYQHWLFLLMGISLSIVQICGIIKIIDSKK